MELNLSISDLGFREFYELCRPEQHFKSGLEGESGRAVNQLTSLSPLYKAIPGNGTNFQA